MGTAAPAIFFNARRTLLATRASAVAPLGEAEMQALYDLTSSPPVVFRPNQMLLETGAPLPAAYLLISGWAMSHEDLPDGGRQIFDFILPGDTIGLSALTLAHASRRHADASDTVEAPFSVTALTDLCAVPVCLDVLDRLYKRHPELVALVLAVTNTQQSARMRRRLTCTGQRQARAQIADLLVELWERLRAADLVDSPQFESPITQAMLGEVLGLTHVHICRTLAGLERDGLLSIETKPRRRVVLHDLDALRAVADISGRRTKKDLDQYRPWIGTRSLQTAMP